jgi:hypothetical protein
MGYVFPGFSSLENYKFILFSSLLQAPAPLESWQGIQNATEDGAACPQPEETYFVPTSEDCLFLNVYTTKVCIFY